MVNWFGPVAWDAPLCTTCPRCDIPVGDRCGRCEGRLHQGDRGVTMPLLKADGTQGVIAFHLDCHIKSILPHSRWAQNGLTPTAADGVENGVFECRQCRVKWTEAHGWEGL